MSLLFQTLVHPCSLSLSYSIIQNYWLYWIIIIGLFWVHLIVKESFLWKQMDKILLEKPIEEHIWSTSKIFFWVKQNAKSKQSWVTVVTFLCVMCEFCPGVDLTADNLMESLDNGVLLCELAQLLQDKMIHNNNGKVMWQHKVMCTIICTPNGKEDKANVKTRNVSHFNNNKIKTKQMKSNLRTVRVQVETRSGPTLAVIMSGISFSACLCLLCLFMFSFSKPLLTTVVFCKDLTPDMPSLHAKCWHNAIGEEVVSSTQCVYAQTH